MRNIMLLAFLLAIVGCSDPYGGRKAVSGKASLASGPIKDGALWLDPLDGQDTPGFAHIVNGEFQIPRESGVKVGKYRVRLSAGDGKTPFNEEEAGGAGGSTNIVSKELVPSSWGPLSKQEITVSNDGPNQFDFDIK